MKHARLGLHPSSNDRLLLTSTIAKCAIMPLIGYAGVSTEDQTPRPQIQELRAAGCTEILEEQASGGSRTRPILARLMEQLRSGDTLVVVRIDRLARSLSHLLDVIERLEAKGAHFGPLLDSIDTASPQGSFSLQILGAAAEFERALIRERTKGGFQSARAEGRFGGNPGLKARDARAIRKARAARVKNHFQKLNGTAEQWVLDVRRFRPNMPWDDVLRVVNYGLPKEAQPWTQARLIRATKTFVKKGLLPESILGHTLRTSKDDRLSAIIAAIKGADPDITLQAIFDRLENMRGRTQRVRNKWQPSSVKMLLERAHGLGFITQST